MHTTEREASLYQELLSFPVLLKELVAIKDDAYGIMLSSPLLSHQNCISRGKKASGGSRVESLVVRVLASRYVIDMEDRVAACRALYEDSDSSDQLLLLSLWGGTASTGSFPPYLLYRYQYFKDEISSKVSDYEPAAQISYP